MTPDLLISALLFLVGILVACTIFLAWTIARRNRHSPNQIANPGKWPGNTDPMATVLAPHTAWPPPRRKKRAPGHRPKAKVSKVKGLTVRRSEGICTLCGEPGCKRHSRRR